MIRNEGLRTTTGREIRDQRNPEISIRDPITGYGNKVPKETFSRTSMDKVEQTKREVLGEDTSPGE